MKKLLPFVILLYVNQLFAQTQTRDNAGLQGSEGAMSGFFETSQPLNYPVDDSNWWHLLDVRHSNTSNNFAMQFAGSFFNQDLYFRKTQNSPNTLWSKVMLERNGVIRWGNQTSYIWSGQDSAGGYIEQAGVNPVLRMQSQKQIDVQEYSQFFIDPIHGFSFMATAGSNGNVGIGTRNPDEKLTVNGKIHAKEIKVDINIPVPDYVFSKDYKLASLYEVKEFVDKNNHLPEIPSGKEIEKNGIVLGELNMLLLKKIEELTLHMIQMKEELDELKGLRQ
ncbi:hypothetical protein [Pseudopedobacter beijingensis]|uniref:Chaperone of endosialidase n=1 Tax=Pseudopedobacter beijingensis TaxID=1207056 RepID=A0ABW4IHZ8_9SPHI